MTTKRDWLLLALSEAQNGTMSPVQVQKAMFVFAKATEDSLPSAALYNFVPYDYGPFDAAIYSDLADMSSMGLIEILNPSSRAQRRYLITPLGLNQIRAAREDRNKFTQYMREVVEWVQKQSFTDLVRSVYEHWPEYKVNSVFRDNVAQ